MWSLMTPGLNKDIWCHVGLGWEDCQHAVIDEFLCMVAGCALGTDARHWMLNNKSTQFKVNKIPL